MTLTAPEIAAARALVEMALAEDLGPSGDRTTLALIAENQIATATFIARAPGVVAGLPIAAMALERVDADLRLNFDIADGTVVAKGDCIAAVGGRLQSLLIAERTALNFLQRLSGIATLTRKFVDAVAGTNAAILDTRKTTPGWRLLEKYAVRCGGGVNHRFGLYDAILIKDNHIAGVNGDVVEAVKRARSFPGNAGLPVEIEVDSLPQLERVLSVSPEIVLLDNMTTDVMRVAVAIRNRLSPPTKLEASGGVNLATVRGIAETGVDRISIGALTHSAPALDIALDL
jgi:nicotinate-nucleotide pyrophosphorylase (carboxylating)